MTSLCLSIFYLFYFGFIVFLNFHSGHVKCTKVFCFLYCFISSKQIFLLSSLLVLFFLIFSFFYFNSGPENLPESIFFYCLSLLLVLFFFNFSKFLLFSFWSCKFTKVYCFFLFIIFLFVTRLHKPKQTPFILLLLSLLIIFSFVSLISLLFSL